MRFALVSSLFLALVGSAHSFSSAKGLASSSPSSRIQPLSTKHSHFPTITNLPRGGSDTVPTTPSSSSALSSLPILPASVAEVTAAVTCGLQSGPYGVLALSAVVASVVTPLTLYRRFYAISVAYGFSVAAAGYALLTAFGSSAVAAAAAPLLLAKASIFYGIRLGGYILLRQVVRDEPTSIKNGTIMERLTFAASLSFFYAFMVTPVLYAMRNPSSTMTLSANLPSIAMGGAYLAWFGAILEAVADLQKLVVKQTTNKKKEEEENDTNTFVGPTSFVYRICRHPNYFGEILFWIGLFVGGAPSFGTSIQAWICSLLGVSGIVSIMLKATKGLEGRQEEKYGGQEKYDDWKKKTYSLIPFVQ